MRTPEEIAKTIERVADKMKPDEAINETIADKVAL